MFNNFLTLLRISLFAKKMSTLISINFPGLITDYELFYDKNNKYKFINKF